MGILSLNSAGMVLILLSWAAQIMWMLRGRKEITAIFAFLQIAGILLIVVSAAGTDQMVAVLNIISAIGAAAVLMIILTGVKKPVKEPKAAKVAKAAKAKK